MRGIDVKETATGIEFKKFLTDNKDIILSVTPVDPSISRDDEWARETEWDQFNKHLREARQ